MVESHFSAGFIRQKINGVWYFLTVRDRRFKNLKTAGGMSSGEETPEETLCRELRQELGIEVVRAEHIHVEHMVGHDRHFFLVHETKDLPALDERRVLAESKGGKPGDVLEMRWATLDEFAERIYHEQGCAFGKILAEMSIDEDFFKKYGRWLSKFPVRD